MHSGSHRLLCMFAKTEHCSHKVSVLQSNVCLLAAQTKKQPASKHISTAQMSTQAGTQGSWLIPLSSCSSPSRSASHAACCIQQARMSPGRPRREGLTAAALRQQNHKRTPSMRSTSHRLPFPSTSSPSLFLLQRLWFSTTTCRSCASRSAPALRMACRRASARLLIRSSEAAGGVCEGAAVKRWLLGA